MTEPSRKPEFDPRDEPNYWDPGVNKDGGDIDAKPKESIPQTEDEDLEARERAETKYDDKPSSIDLSEREAGNEERNSYLKPPTNSKLNVKKRWKKFAIGGGLFGLFGTAFYLLFILLPTLKIPHILANLDKRFLTYASNAVAERADTILSRYMTRYVFPSVTACGTVISKDCNPDYDPGRGIVSNLYRNWHNARFEQKLFVDHGIRVEREGANTNRFTIITSSGSAINNIDPDNFDLGELRRDVGSRQVVRTLSQAFENETFYKRIMLRHNLRELARDKWNVRWCLFACETRDDLDDRRTTSLTKLKLRITERMLSPFSDRLALYLSCTITNCSNDDYFRERSRLVNRVVEELGEEGFEAIVNDVGDRTFRQFVVEKIFTKIFGSTVGKVAAAGVPVVGLIYMVDAADQIDRFLYTGGLSKFLADSNASQYAEFYLTMRSHIDEAQDGQLTLEEVGAINQLYEGMEASKVYQRDLGSGFTATTSPFTQQAYAQEEYVCAGGQPVPDDELVCPERRVDTGSALDRWRQEGVAATITNVTLGQYRCGPLLQFFCLPGSTADTIWFLDAGIHFIFSTFETAIGFLANLALDILRVVPGIDEFIEWVQSYAETFLKFLLELVFPFLDVGTGPGRQVFDDTYAGGDVVGNAFAQGFEDPETGELLGLGGRRLTDAEVEANLVAARESELEDFKNQSFFTRLFSPQESNSMVSRLAFSLPLPAQPTPQSITGTLMALLNPTYSTSTSLAIALSDPVHAQFQYQGDPFGIDQYGYAINDPMLDIDPEELTIESCSEGGQYYDAWKEGIEGDEDDEPLEGGQLIHSVANPCMLEEAIVNMFGSWFTDLNDGGI